MSMREGCDQRGPRSERQHQVEEDLRMPDIELEIAQIRNAILWNEDRMNKTLSEVDRRRYENNIRNLKTDLYDLIRWDAINSY